MRPYQAHPLANEKIRDLRRAAERNQLLRSARPTPDHLSPVLGRPVAPTPDRRRPHQPHQRDNQPAARSQIATAVRTRWKNLGGRDQRSATHAWTTAVLLRTEHVGWPRSPSELSTSTATRTPSPYAGSFWTQNNGGSGP